MDDRRAADDIRRGEKASWALVFASQWDSHAIPPMQVARSNHKAVSVDGQLVVLGGLGAYNETLSSVEIFDLRTGQWLFLASMSEARFDFVVAVVKRKILVFGGRRPGDDGLAGNEVLDLDRLDLGWQRVRDGPTGRYGATAVVYGTKIALLGGTDSIGNVLRRVDVYDPETGQLTTLPDMPSERHAHAAELVGDSKIIVTAGFTGQGFYAAGVDMLNLATGTWRRLADAPRPMGIASAVAMNPRYLFIANRVSVPLYDHMTNTWSTLPPRPTTRGCESATMMGSKLVVVGGFDTSSLKKFRSVEVLETTPLVDAVFENIRKRITNDDLESLRDLFAVVDPAARDSKRRRTSSD